MNVAAAAVKVLMDHSVRQDAITEEHGFDFAETELLGVKYRHLQPTTRTTPPRSDWKQAEIEALPRVAELIHQGQIQAFTTHELNAEAFPVAKFPSPRYTDIFEGCAFNVLPAPLERSKWGLDDDRFCSKEDVIDYCECFFLTASSERIERFIIGMEQILSSVSLNSRRIA